MRTTEVVEYETEEITHTRVICDKCDMDFEPSRVHPIEAGGNDFAYCRECYESEFDTAPKVTVAQINDAFDGDVDKDEFRMIDLIPSVLIAFWHVGTGAIEAHNQFVKGLGLALRDEHPEPMSGPAEGLLGLTMYCLVMGLALMFVIAIVSEVVTTLT